MNAFAKVDKQAFLRFAAQHAEERFEFVRGRIVQQMTGGTRDHAGIARRMTRQIEDQLDASKWWVLNDRGVETADTIRYPDIVVEPSDEPGQSLCTARPVVIVEVLSKSTASSDLDVKPAEYMSLTSLDAYIIASQDEAAALVYERAADGLFPVRPREVEGSSQIAIKGRRFELTLDMSKIYSGIVSCGAPSTRE